jgi:hypothetical protein
VLATADGTRRVAGAWQLLVRKGAIKVIWAWRSISVPREGASGIFVPNLAMPIHPRGKRRGQLLQSVPIGK